MRCCEWNGRLVALIVLLITASAFLSGELFTVVLAQGEPTATPDAEGVIYVVVQPNDSLWSISSQAGITLPELLAYNNLTEDTVIQPGQLLIIGYGTPAPTPTIEQPTPTPTSTRPPPTATGTAVPPPRTAICLIAFDDLDRDGVWDGDEPSKASVAFTIFNQESVVGNYISDGVSEPYCLEGLAPGEYKITRSVGRNEELTTSGDWALTLTSGNVLNLEFGSTTRIEGTATSDGRGPAPEPALSAESVGVTPDAAGAPEAETGGDNAALIYGAMLLTLLIGIGGLVALRRSRSKSQG